MLTNIAVGATPARARSPSADFDGDGDDDVAVANATSGNVVLLRNNGAEGFGQESPAGTPAGAAPSDIVAADFDGNGRPDVAVANAVVEHRLGAAAQRGQRRLHRRLPARRSRSAPARAGSPPPTSTATASPISSSPPRAGSPRCCAAPALAFAADAPIALTGNPTGATTADFNLDGVADAAISSRGTNQLHVLLSPSPPAQPPPAPTPDPHPAADARRSPGGRGQSAAGQGHREGQAQGLEDVRRAQGRPPGQGGRVGGRAPRHGDDRRPGQRRQGELLRRAVPDQPVQGADHADADRGARLPQAGQDGGPRSRRRASCGATARAASAPRAATARPPCAAPSGSSPTPAPRPRRG